MKQQIMIMALALFYIGCNDEGNAPPIASPNKADTVTADDLDRAIYETDDDSQDLDQGQEDSIKLTKNYMDPKTEITWEDDILPFLKSNGFGTKYQCITCHTEYKDKNTLLRPGEIDRMIRTMRSSGPTFMPRIGDRVPAGYIVMLKRWERETKGLQIKAAP